VGLPVLVQLDPVALANILIRSLGDPCQEIGALTHLILAKLYTNLPESFKALKSESILAGLEAPLKKVLDTKLNDSAVKADLDRQAELRRGVVRVVHAVRAVCGPVWASIPADIKE
jgi:hypothetical protein